MTLLGKIFTVLVFIMSIVFMVAASMVFATHRNWKQLALNPTATGTIPLGLKQQLDNKTNELKLAQQNLQEAQNKLAAEQAARRFALAALQSKLAVLEDQHAKKQKELDDLIANHGKAAQALETAELTLSKLTDEVTGLRDEIRKTQQDRDLQFDRVVTLTDSLNQAEGVRGRLQERSEQLGRQVASAKRLLEGYGVKLENPPPARPIKVDGVVLAVGQKDMIEISLGSDDGVREGMSMEVYRGGQYLGRIIVRKTEPDRAVAQIVRELLRGQMKEGDIVTNKLG